MFVYLSSAFQCASFWEVESGPLALVAPFRFSEFGRLHRGTIPSVQLGITSRVKRRLIHCHSSSIVGYMDMVQKQS